jgi:hypothetical protein
MGQGEKNNESATPIQVAGGEGELKQNLRQMDGSLNYIFFMQPLRVLKRQIFTLSGFYVSLPYLLHSADCRLN